MYFKFTYLKKIAIKKTDILGNKQGFFDQPIIMLEN